MNEPKKEHFSVINKDKELHCIDVMLEVLKRNLDRSNDGPCNSDVNIENGKAAMIRCARYVLERIQ